MSKPNTEIERKWLVKGWPTGLVLKEHHMVQQGYIYVNEEIEVRMTARFDFEDYCGMFSMPNKLKLTIKEGSGLIRAEHEIVLSPEQFTKMRRGIKGDPILKEFRIYEQPQGQFQAGCSTIEISHVDPGKPTSFMYSEVEFASKVAADYFDPPAALQGIIDQEVTGDDFWNMKNYWLRTR